MYLTNLCVFFSLSHYSRNNRLAVDSVDESSLAHLSNLQVLDIGTGNSELHFKRDEMEEELET